MDPSLHLAVHNILSILSVIVTAGLALFTYLNGTKKIANITFALVLLAGIIFTVSHTIGINVQDSELSRKILMLNLIMFVAAPLQVHSVLALIGKDKDLKWFISSLYLAGVFFIILFIVSPKLFLLPSVPKMYFPNYYNPGVLNWIRIIFLDGLTMVYCSYQLIKSAKYLKSEIEKKQYLFFTLTLIIGYGVLFIPNFLVYNIQIDPLWGHFFAPLFGIPFIYSAMKYELFSVKIVAKQAFVYSIAIAAVGGFITLLDYLNDSIKTFYPHFPPWAFSLFSAFLVVTVSVFVWRKLQENDLLKYEFITTMTHKFRTPLTGIRWATENLGKANLTDDNKVQLGYIKSENAKLVELTNLLTSISRSENDSYNYHLKSEDLSRLVDEVVKNISEQIKVKNIFLEKNLSSGANVNIDVDRTRFVIQVLLENAVHYTPQGGKILVSTFEKERMVYFSVEDSGIGISKNDFPYLFTKFYRGDKARIADTEGVGVGLFISEEIISRQNGKIWAESKGENLGSTFTFSLPVAKK